MAAGFPLEINNIKIKSSEALYQALRFTEYPEIQSEIINQNSPMTAKMKSKKYRDYSRADWNDIRILVMRWCIRIKLIQNWDSFGRILMETGDKDIVEEFKNSWNVNLKTIVEYKTPNAENKRLNIKEILASKETK